MSAAYRGKTSISMGSYQRTPEEYKASVWCIQNNICITPRQAKWGVGMWYIDIEKGMYPNRKLIVVTSWPVVWINNPDIVMFYSVGMTPYFY